MKRACSGMLTATVVVLALAACGDGGGTGGGGAPTAASPPTLARMDANCKALRGGIVRLAEQAFAGAPDPRETTARVVKPSLRMLEAFARRQQRLAADSGNADLILYARLFEPTIVLAQERLQLGERFTEGDAAAIEPIRGYEQMMTTVAGEQRAIARRAGLRACAIDFTRVLSETLNG